MEDLVHTLLAACRMEVTQPAQGVIRSVECALRTQNTRRTRFPGGLHLRRPPTRRAGRWWLFRRAAIDWFVVPL